MLGKAGHATLTPQGRPRGALDGFVDRISKGTVNRHKSGPQSGPNPGVGRRLASDPDEDGDPGDPIATEEETTIFGGTDVPSADGGARDHPGRGMAIAAAAVILMGAWH